MPGKRKFTSGNNELVSGGTITAYFPNEYRIVIKRLSKVADKSISEVVRDCTMKEIKNEVMKYYDKMCEKAINDSELASALNRIGIEIKRDAVGENSTVNNENSNSSSTENNKLGIYNEIISVM